MSIANLLVANRQSSANLKVNSMGLAPLTTAEKASVAPEEGVVVYDSDKVQLSVGNGTSWDSLPLVPSTGARVVEWALASTVAVNIGQEINPYLANVHPFISSGGYTVSSDGVFTATNGAIHRIKGQFYFVPQGGPIGSGQITIEVAQNNGGIKGAVLYRTRVPYPATATGFVGTFDLLYDNLNGETVGIWVWNTTNQVLNLYVDSATEPWLLNHTSVEYLGDGQ